jgi:hypothetical protein
MPDGRKQPQVTQSKDKHISTDRDGQQPGGSAVRHVGKTLESDPGYNEHPSRELAPQIGLIDPHGNDISASPNMHAGSDPLVGTELSETGSGLRVEPLKTRLPDDEDPALHPGPVRHLTADAKNLKQGQ